MPKIYLAGPIANCSDDELHDWREEAKSLLGDAWTYLDPTSRDFREKDATKHAAEIVEGDKDDINQSAVVLAHMWKLDGPMIGTSMELHYAYCFEVPTVVVVPPEYRVSPWITYHAERVFTSLEDACAFINLSFGTTAAQRGVAVASA